MLPGLLANVHRSHDCVTGLLRASCCNFIFTRPWFSPMAMLCANFNHIFSSIFINYQKGEEFSVIFDVLVDGIFNSDGESWWLQRKKTHDFMADHNFVTFLINSGGSKVSGVLFSLLPLLAGEGKEKVQDVFMSFTFDVICELVFVVNPKFFLLEYFSIMFFSKPQDVLSLRWKLLRWSNVGEEAKLARAPIVINKFITDDLLIFYIKATSSIDDVQESNKILKDPLMKVVGKENS
ncbi:putative cytochrome P450 superfamily [Dioscorea sansibarensis]